MNVTVVYDMSWGVFIGVYASLDKAKEAIKKLLHDREERSKGELNLSCLVEECPLPNDEGICISGIFILPTDPKGEDPWDDFSYHIKEMTVE